MGDIHIVHLQDGRVQEYLAYDVPPDHPKYGVIALQAIYPNRQMYLNSLYRWQTRPVSTLVAQQ